MLGNKLKLGNDVDNTAKDVLGGNSVRETDIYTGKVSNAYFIESKKGAIGVTVEFNEGGSTLKFTQYVTTNKEKGQLPYYEKDGTKYPLAGFTIINDLCLLTTNEELHTIADEGLEQKVVELYNFDLRKAVPTEVSVLVPLIGEEVSLGVFKKLVNKLDSQGNPTNETREINEVTKVFHAETRGTVAELQADNDSAGTFWDQWLEKNKGRVIDATTAAAGKSSGFSKSSASDGDTEEKPKKKLFGKK